MTKLLIIKTEKSAEIKALLNQKHINYQVIVDETIQDHNLTEEEVWRCDIRLANQDKQRNKVISELDAVSDEDDWEDIKENEWS